MEDNEELAIKNALDTFLRRACEKAKGDIRKNINIHEIWDNDFPIRALDKALYLPIIVRLLKTNNFIQDDDHENEIRVTYKGIYYIVDTLGIPAETLGVLPYNEVKKYLDYFLKILYAETKGDATKAVNISDIQRRGLSGLGDIPIRQVTDYLEMKSMIEYAGNENLVKIPTKHLTKAYDASKI
jgi:hypothetical protein